MKSKLLSALWISFSVLLACGGNTTSDDGNVSAGGTQTSVGTGGASAASSNSGGTLAEAGAENSASPVDGGAAAGGNEATGGASAEAGGTQANLGGTTAGGGVTAATGGSTLGTGGVTQTNGGTQDIGGATGAGGVTQDAGGSGALGGTGGDNQAGGASPVGGMSATGGTSAEPLHCSDSDSLQVISLAAGTIHTCALMSNGGVRCWGGNEYGQLGDGTTTDHYTPPTSDILTGVKAIAAGVSHTCAIMETGGVRCWGYNGYGQLGDGTSTNRSTPGTSDVFTGVTGVRAIATGSNHTCALRNTGDVLCWGYNNYGQLGDGSVTSHSSPSGAVTTGTGQALTGVQAIVAGNNHTCALTGAGGVRCWGRNDYGQLGDNSNDGCTDRFYFAHGTFLIASVPCLKSPRTNDVVTGVKSIAAGDDYTCALMDTGGMRCWGANFAGQLGQSSDSTCTRAVGAGPIESTTTSGGTITTTTVPCAVRPPTSDALTGARAIATGGAQTCALMSTGGMRCWGSNSRGQLGDGTTTNSSTPPTSDVLTGVQAIAAGGAHTCALMETGGVRCWGYDYYGELGYGPPLGGRFSPVQVVGTCE